eukprot:COSAG05_NODE_823_length_7122_cov_13.546917_6_plen_111_part_00
MFAVNPSDNAPDYTTWDREQLSPALAQIPLSKLGAGLGCWVDHRTRGTWNLKPQSASERVCLPMNKSVQVSLVDAFVLPLLCVGWGGGERVCVCTPCLCITLSLRCGAGT